MRRIRTCAENIPEVSIACTAFGCSGKGQCDARQPRATTERSVAYVGDRRRDGDARQSPTLIERTFADGGCRCNDNGFQRSGDVVIIINVSTCTKNVSKVAIASEVFGRSNKRKCDAFKRGASIKCMASDFRNAIWNRYAFKRLATIERPIADGGDGRRNGDASQPRTFFERTITNYFGILMNSNRCDRRCMV